MKNPVLLVPRGERGALELDGGVRAFVLRGAHPGPTVWAWAPGGDGDPALQQALGELRDRLHPRRLRGALGLLLDGPAPPLEREAYAWAPLCRAITSDAAAVVLFMSLPPGYLAMPHAALDVADKDARRIGRALRARFLVPPIVAPRLDRGIIRAPAVMWIDGESERISREVIDRATGGLESLLERLGMLRAPAGGRAPAPACVVLKRVVDVDALGPGVVEPVVRPGDLVSAGQVVAHVGEPGLLARRALRAPVDGVTLFVRSGRQLGGTVVGIGRLSRTLERVRARHERDGGHAGHAGHASHARPGADGAPQLGWCEHVALPDLGVARLQAKIDTGARTSALHVARMTQVGRSGGRARLEIEIPSGEPAGRAEPRTRAGTRARGKRGARTVTALVEVVEHTLVRDSGGHAERRPVIETTLRLGAVERTVRVSLTDRGDMRFPMLVGRTALPPEATVHPSRRWLLG